jgi:hypothetical protein
MAGPALVELPATIPDPRKPRGRIHPLGAAVSLAVVAIRAGMKSLGVIAQFSRDHGAGLPHALGFRRKKTPAKSASPCCSPELDYRTALTPHARAPAS